MQAPLTARVHGFLRQLVTYLELRLACSHEGHADAKLLADADAAIAIESALATTRATLGMRHWATIKLLNVQSLWLCVQLSMDAHVLIAGSNHLNPWTACRLAPSSSDQLPCLTADTGARCNAP